MIKLLVADDEVWIRERIAREIPWQTIGAEMVGTAEDGLEALEKIEQLLPDIMITDIRMPGMDGIELLRELNNRFIQIKVIILSGYDDFAYAQEALRYGAFDYVLKPAEDEELLEVVGKCIMALKVEREREKRIQGLEKRAELGYWAVKEKMLLDVVSGDYREEKNDRNMEYDSAWNIFRNEIEKSMHRCILVAINHPAKEPERRELEHFIIKNIMTEILEKYGYVNKAYFNSRTEWLFVLSCDQQENMLSGLLSDLEMVKDVIMQKLELDITIGVGECSDDFFNLAYSYQTLRSLMKYRKWVSNNHIIYHPVNIATQIKTMGRYSTAKLSLYLKQDLFSEAERELLDIYKIATKNVPQTERAVILRMVSMDVEKEFYQYFLMNTDENNANYFRIEFWNEIDDMENEEQFLALLYRFKQNQKENMNKVRRIALKVRDYVVKNYGQPLSLNDVAEYLDLNASYLCRVFKEEMNMSFVTFLQNYRIEKAADLLIHTDHKIHEISELVGYENQQYFSKVFRNIKGVPPSAFRDNMKTLQI